MALRITVVGKQQLKWWETKEATTENAATEGGSACDWELGVHVAGNVVGEVAGDTVVHVERNGKQCVELTTRRCNNSDVNLAIILLYNLLIYKVASCEALFLEHTLRAL